MKTLLRFGRFVWVVMATTAAWASAWPADAQQQGPEKGNSPLAGSDAAAGATQVAQIDIDWDRARQLHDKSQRGQPLSAEDQAYLQRAQQSLAARQHAGGGASERGGGIDWQRAQELYQKSQRGERLSPDDQAYLDRAKRQRQGGAGSDSPPRGGPPATRTKTPPSANPRGGAPQSSTPTASAVASTQGLVASALPPPPLTYQAVSDRKVYPKPPLPKLGPAGTIINDPTFGCPILRVSDENTAEGHSLMTPATAFSNPWNTDSTLFCVQADGARNVPFRFDPKTMTASRIKDWPFLPDIANEVAFSRREPNICYGRDRRHNGVVRIDFSTNQIDELLDVGKVTGLEVGYLGTLSVGANDVLALIFGGAMQDASPYLLLYDIQTHQHRLWNTKQGTVDGKAVENAPHFTQHSGLIDLGGRFFVTLGPGVHGPTVWDSKTDQIYAITAQRDGHYALGFGEMINDPHNLAYRALDAGAVDSPTRLVEHPAGEPYFAYDGHESWNNSRPGMRVPVLLTTYHAVEFSDPKCAWGDEVVAVATDGSGQVWRFAHHRSLAHARGDAPTQNRGKGYNFWDCPRGNVSQDGRFYMFTSNWEETLGKDSQDRFREDAFIVKLQRADASANTPR
jgi:hypothetical protein